MNVYYECFSICSLERRLELLAFYSPEITNTSLTVLTVAFSCLLCALGFLESTSGGKRNNSALVLDDAGFDSAKVSLVIRIYFTVVR
jgi:hypothetical protein